MLSQRRSRPLARPRQVAMYLAKKMTTSSFEIWDSVLKEQINDNLSQEITLDSEGNYKIENLTKGEYKIIVFDNLNCKSAEVSTEILEIAPVFDISNISTLDSNSNNIIEGNKPECYNGLGISFL